MEYCVLIAKSTVFDESFGCMHMHYNNCIQLLTKAPTRKMALEMVDREQLFGMSTGISFVVRDYSLVDHT